MLTPLAPLVPVALLAPLVALLLQLSAATAAAFPADATAGTAPTGDAVAAFFRKAQADSPLLLVYGQPRNSMRRATEGSGRSLPCGPRKCTRHERITA